MCHSVWLDKCKNSASEVLLSLPFHCQERALLCSAYLQSNKLPGHSSKFIGCIHACVFYLSWGIDVISTTVFVIWSFVYCNKWSYCKGWEMCMWFMNYAVRLIGKKQCQFATQKQIHQETEPQQGERSVFYRPNLFKNAEKMAHLAFQATASCNSCNALSHKGWHPPTFPWATLSASAKPIFKSSW